MTGIFLANLLCFLFFFFNVAFSVVIFIFIFIFGVEKSPKGDKTVLAKIPLFSEIKMGEI
jgi:hypothetical protein